MKILVPVDGSPFTKRMLAYLAAHDEWLGPQHAYTLLHVAPPVPPQVVDGQPQRCRLQRRAEVERRTDAPVALGQVRNRGQQWRGDARAAR